MKNILIINALFFKEKAKSSLLESNKFKHLNAKEIYIKNAFVSLFSAKLQQPNATVMLITNNPLPSKWEELFNENNISIEYAPFKIFKTNQDFNWEYAFYKLDALNYAISKYNYDLYLLVDSDTVFIRPLNPMIEELSYDNILLYELDYSISQPMRKLIYTDYNRFNNTNKNISQYGGELIAGNSQNLKKLMNYTLHYYSLFKQEGFKSTNVGDEYLLSMAATHLNVKNASPYISRNWTRGNGYIASSRWSDENCLIIHLISEKALGMIHLFKYIKKRHKLPSIEIIAQICNLPKKRGKRIDRDSFRTIINYLLRLKK